MFPSCLGFTPPFCVSPTTSLGILKCPGSEMSGDVPQRPGCVMSSFACKPLANFSESRHPHASKVRGRAGHRLLPLTENISETHACKIIARKTYRLTWSSYNNCPPISLFHKCVIRACELSPLTFPSVSILLLFLVAM